MFRSPALFLALSAASFVPGEEVQEFVCEDNNRDAVHLFGKSAGVN